MILVLGQAADREFLIRVSYMEIYNEEINDLLTLRSEKLPTDVLEVSGSGIKLASAVMGKLNILTRA